MIYTVTYRVLLLLHHMHVHTPNTLVHDQPDSPAPAAAAASPRLVVGGLSD